MIKVRQSRREFISSTVGAAAGLCATPRSRADEQQKSPPRVTARDYLSKLVYKKEEIDGWFDRKMYGGTKHHPVLGYLFCDGRAGNGLDRSICTYTYAPGGERIMINHVNKPCRINTYGNSFTLCSQVNDGETWQEVLAAHLGEPIRNFGIGGYSVYQAYLRMLLEERTQPAPFIIFNIYSSDHWRNLISWRRIAKGVWRSALMGTVPYLKGNPKTGQIAECENMCKTRQDYHRLCDLDWVCDKFKDDFVLQIMLAQANAKAENPDYRIINLERLARTERVYTKAALFSSMKVIEWVEDFARKNNKKVLYVLSYPWQHFAEYKRENTLHDRPFVEFMKQKNLPVVDLLAEHVKDFDKFGMSIEEYNGRYWIGHYNPAGNFFCAFAIKNKLVEMLEPKPPAYQKG